MRHAHLFTIAAILVVSLQASTFWMAAMGSPSIIGDEWLSPTQRVYADHALTHYCPRNWVIFTPWHHPKYNGYSTASTVTIFDVQHWRPYELYCLIRHECEETLQGETHDWSAVLEECR